MYMMVLITLAWPLLVSNINFMKILQKSLHYSIAVRSMTTVLLSGLKVAVNRHQIIKTPVYVVV